MSMYIWTVIFGVFGLPFIIISAILRRDLPKFIVKLWVDVILFLFQSICHVRIELRGYDNIPKENSAIIASKHQSALETLVYYQHWSPSYILKRELYYIPIFGWYLALSGMIAINRSMRTRAMRLIMREAGGRLKDGRHLVIFPEGTRVPIGQKKPYNKGVYKLYELGYPVIPVALNTGKIWVKRKLPITPGKAIFSFMPALPTGLSSKDFNSFLEKVIEAETEKILTEDTSY